MTSPHRSVVTRSRLRRAVYPLVAAGLAGAVLPLTGGSAGAADATSSASPSATSSASPTETPTETPSETPEETPTTSGTPAAYTGYSGSAVSAPVKLEIFEPTIPIPTSPQLEVDMGYSKVTSDSSGTVGRSSYLWPGDPIGEGEKTFIEQLGLPEALGAAGYPVQVNAQYPGDTTSQKQEPFPGTVMRTTAGEKQVEASTGFSSNCDVADGDPGITSGSGGSGGSGGGLPIPGLPSIPGLPALPLLPSSLSSMLSSNPLTDLLGSLSGAATSTSTSNPPATGSSRTVAPSKRGSALTASSGTSGSGSASTTDDSCPLPAALDAIVDVGGYVSDSTSTATDSLASTGSRSALGDVRLLGGLITMSGLTAKAVTTSDGQVGKATGQATYGTITIAGVPFSFGPDGFDAAGQNTPIPGLPDDPTAALAALGVTLTVPQPVFTTDGSKATSTVEGLIVTIDMKTLSPVLSQLNLGPLLDAIPFPPQAAPLKSLLGAAYQLSPRFVVHLGYATSTVNTVQGIAMPTSPVPDNDPGSSPSASAGGTTTTGGGSTGTPSGTGLGAPPPATDAGTTTPTPEATGNLPNAALSSGLPKLFSIPGLVMVAGLVGAVFAGSYVRRIGALVLGAGGACPHGLDSGLPDLRKAQ